MGLQFCQREVSERLQLLKRNIFFNLAFFCLAFEYIVFGVQSNLYLLRRPETR